MTNYERIKNMSVEEMAEWLEDTLSDNRCYLCDKRDIDKCGYFEKDFESRVTMCVRNRKKWLEGEAQE